MPVIRANSIWIWDAQFDFKVESLRIYKYLMAYLRLRYIDYGKENRQAYFKSTAKIQLQLVYQIWICILNPLCINFVKRVDIFTYSLKMYCTETLQTLTYLKFRSLKVLLKLYVLVLIHTGNHCWLTYRGPRIGIIQNLKVVIRQQSGQIRRDIVTAHFLPYDRNT